LSREEKPAVIVLLLAAMAALALAPLLMPDSYSVLGHSVSESAAQGVDGAWLARLAFLLSVSPCSYLPSPLVQLGVVGADVPTPALVSR
jgi:hypothetical protein